MAHWILTTTSRQQSSSIHASTACQRSARKTRRKRQRVSEMNHEEIIQEIIRIMRIDGELATDGECLEMVSDLLDDNGYGPVHPTINRTGNQWDT